MLTEIQTILYAMCISATMALFVFRWDLIKDIVKQLCDDDDDDGPGGGKLIPATIISGY